MTPRRTRLTLLALLAFCAACGAPQPAPTLESPATSVPPRSTAASTLPSASPTPSATLAPGPRVFSEEFEGGLPYWDFRTVDNGQTIDPPTVINGFMIFNLPAPNQWAYELYNAQDYTDVRVDAKVEMRAGGQSAAGVICRYDETGGWYEFNIYPDQTYVLLYGHWLSAGVAGYTPLVQAQSEKIQPVENELGLLCEGNVLTPFVNGTQLRRRQETTFGLAAGKIGVAAASFENASGSIAFDSVKVSEP